MSEYFCFLPIDFLPPAFQSTLVRCVALLKALVSVYSVSKIVFIRTLDSLKLGVLVVGLKYHKQTLFLGKLSFLLISFFCYFRLSKLSLFFGGVWKFLFLVKELHKIRFRKCIV